MLARTDRPAVLPLSRQPIPRFAQLQTLPFLGGMARAIHRVWRPGDSVRCRLCDACTAVGDSCTVVVDVPVPAAGMPLALFSTRGLVRVGVPDEPRHGVGDATG